MKVLVLFVICCVFVMGKVLSNNDGVDDIIVDGKTVPIVGTETPTTPVIDVQEEMKKAASASEEAQHKHIYTEEELKTWPLVTLRKFLLARGLTCKGCTQKDDFVEMAVKNRHLPEVESPSTESKPHPESPPPTPDPNEIEKLMRKLKKGGFGNSKFFSADDLRDLSPDELSEKINGKQGGKSKNSKKSSKKQKKQQKSSSETTESTTAEESAPSSEADSKDAEKETKKKPSKKSKSEKNNKKSDSKKQKKSSFDKSTNKKDGKASKKVEEPLEEETIEL